MIRVFFWLHHDGPTFVLGFTGDCSKKQQDGKDMVSRKNLAFPIEPYIPSDSMLLEDPDQLHLRAAHGYIQLEMFEEANAELEEIDPFCRHLPAFTEEFRASTATGEKLNDYAALWLQHRPAAVEGSAIAPKIAL